MLLSQYRLQIAKAPEKKSQLIKIRLVKTRQLVRIILTFFTTDQNWLISCQKKLFFKLVELALK